VASPSGGEILAKPGLSGPRWGNTGRMTTPERMLDGRYRLIDPIAHGGTAEVWRAHDEKLARPVAIKLIDAGADTARVQEEAQALARLNHPHIANVFDY